LDTHKIQAVLFACTYNAIRSPMAEGLFKRRFGSLAYVQSCGLKSGSLDPMAVFTMDDIGIDISSHKTRTFDELEDDNFDLIISLSPEAHHRALEFTRHLALDVEYWPTFDPTAIDGSREQQMQAYEQVRDELDRKIKDRFAGLKA
jgi:protein-tyrosine-phosphatase